MKTPARPGMKKTRAPWSTKLRPDMRPAVVPDAKTGGRLLLPTPMLIVEEMNAIPEGDLVSVPELRLRLARRFDADGACPLMTGIFYNIIAGAAEEDAATGTGVLAPYWRVVPANGSLSPKTPAGPEVQARHLEAEGHRLELRRGKWVVADFKER